MYRGIAVGFFVTDQVQPLGFGDRLGEPLKGVYYSDLHMGGHQLATQLVGILFTLGWSFIWTFCFAQIIDKTIGLKNDESDDDIEKVENDIWTVSMKKEDNVTIVINEDDGVNAGNHVNSDEAIF
jgi:ammonia channel protein AmtB